MTFKVSAPADIIYLSLMYDIKNYTSSGFSYRKRIQCNTKYVANKGLTA